MVAPTHARTQIGAIGGIFGALFVQANRLIAQFRLKRVNKSKLRRLLDVVLVKTICSFAVFFVPYFLGTCSPQPAAGSGDNSSSADTLIEFYCPDGQYNDIASFWFLPTEVRAAMRCHLRVRSACSTCTHLVAAFLCTVQEAIRQLFHFPNVINLWHLAVFFGVYIVLMCISSGEGAPTAVDGASASILPHFAPAHACPGRRLQARLYLRVSSFPRCCAAPRWVACPGRPPTTLSPRASRWTPARTR